MYNDGKYHYQSYPLLYSKVRYIFIVVNTYGEPCSLEGSPITFFSQKTAQKYVDELNKMPEGGVCTNMT